MKPASRKAFSTALGFAWLLLLAGELCAAAPGVRYTGRVLYRGGKAPVPGVLVEIVEAKDDGQPTDEVLGYARTDEAGRFTVTLEKSTDAPVTLTVSAVRASAESGGDRRREGYQIRTLRIQLGVFPFPSATKPNTVQIERRRPGALPGEGGN